MRRHIELVESLLRYRNNNKRQRVKVTDWSEKIFNWCQIANIACRWNDDSDSIRSRAFYISDYNDDACKKKHHADDATCEKDPQCVMRKSSSGVQQCVDKRNLKYLEAHELSASFISQSNKIEFKILVGPIPFLHDGGKDSNIYFKQENMRQTTVKRPYVHIVYIRDTLFILCNCGVTLNMKGVKEQETRWFDQIYNELSKLNPADTEIVIAGHSMGCAIALRFANYMKSKHEVMFNNNCFVLGSGHFPCLEKDDVILRETDKVKMFATIRRSDKRDLMWVDPFIVDETNEGFQCYFPLQVLEVNKDANVVTRTATSPEFFNRATYTSEILHEWATYFNAFSVLHESKFKTMESAKEYFRKVLN